MTASVRRLLAEHGLAAAGDRVVVTAGLPLGTSGATNLIRVLELE
jgi:pyruvate kinase